MPVSRHRRRRGGAAASRGSRSASDLSLTRPRRRKTNKLYLAAAVIIAVLVIGSFGLTTLPFGGGSGSGSSAALIGDHWHASLLLEICGDEIALPPSPGGVHSHGDGLIHIHPESADEAGRNATLGRYFDSLDVVMESDRVELPSGQLYVNGDPCPDGSLGRLQVLVNGEDLTETFRTYTPRDDERVEVYFR